MRVLKAIGLLCVIGAIVIGIPMALLLGSVFLEGHRLEPMFASGGYGEFVQKYHLEIMTEKMIRVEEKEYRVVYLRCSRNPFYLPSGCPVMIFDSGSNVVDHCSDVGDARRFVERWRLPHN